MHAAAVLAGCCCCFTLVPSMLLSVLPAAVSRRQRVLAHELVSLFSLTQPGLWADRGAAQLRVLPRPAAGVCGLHLAAHPVRQELGQLFWYSSTCLLTVLCLCRCFAKQARLCHTIHTAVPSSPFARRYPALHRPYCIPLPTWGCIAMLTPACLLLVGLLIVPWATVRQG